MRKQIIKLSLIVSAAVVLVPSVLYAQSTSTNYGIQEDFTGSGGSVESTTPTQYGGTRDAAGDTAVGDSDNDYTPGGTDTYRLQSGYVTDGEPRLAFIVNTSSINFSDLSTTTAKTGTATFSVLNYTSYGYVVTTYGQPPSSGSYVLAGMPITDASQVGTEQFGLNLRANTSPITFGADAVQVPDSSFSNGGAAGGYSTANNFRYVEGETIASAAESSGQTDYTVSYIVNISTLTAGGNYTGKQGFICTGTY
jgi:hypothetical protein